MTEPRERQSGGAKVVLVGHCGPDVALLRTAVSRALPEASIVSAGDETQLERHAHAGALLLVNRVLDGAYADRSGLDLIRRMNARPDGPAAILVSNYPEWQERAVAAGAMPGFGKRDLFVESTAVRLRVGLAAACRCAGPGGGARL
jgi:two-component system chemotaxis response regulator CheY